MPFINDRNDLSHSNALNNDKFNSINLIAKLKETRLYFKRDLCKLLQLFA